MAFDKKRLRRELERDRRAAQKAEVRRLREQITTARRDRRDRITAIRQRCRAARDKLRALCLTRRQRAWLEGATLIEKRRRELGQELELEKLVRAGDRRHVKGSVRSTAKERAEESDDAVRANIPDDLVPVFNRHRRHIRASPRRTRTEAFLEWAAENPGEVLAEQSAGLDQEIRRMVAEHNRQARAAGMSEVPF